MASTTTIKNNKGATTRPGGTEQRIYTPAKLALFLFILSFIAYANTLKNGYALDDFSAIEKNTIVTKGIAAIPELLATPYHQGYNPSANDLYRPLSLVMFAAEYQLFGPTPAVGHFINLLLFCGCVALLFLFLNTLFKGQKVAIAFIATLLFALHPIHTEVVANIKSRDELLCFFFAFLTLRLWMQYAATGKMMRLLLGAGCFFLSLLAKETSITFVAIVALVFFFYENEHKKQRIIITASSVVTAAAYLVIRMAVLRSHHADNLSDIPFIDNALVSVPAGASRLATAFLMLGMYIKLLFVPYPLVCDYGFHSVPFARFSDIGFIVSLLAYGAIAAAAVYRLIKYPKDVLAFGLLFFLITISLFSNIPFLLGAAMAERFVFFASAGFCIAVATGIAALLQRNGTPEQQILQSSKTWIILAPVALILMGMTISRNSDWVDNYTLYSKDVAQSPRDARLHYYLGNELVTKIFETEQSLPMKRKALTDGIASLQQSIAIYADYNSAHEDIGHAFFLLQQYDSAEVHDKKALALNPKNTIALSNLAGIYFTQKKYQQAIDLCKKAIMLNPGNTEICRNIAYCYQNMQQFDSAIVYYRTVTAKEPANMFAIENLAISFKAAGNMDSAKKYESIARLSEPGFRVN